MEIQRRRFLELAAGAAAVPPLFRIARAQTYPSRATGAPLNPAAVAGGHGFGLGPQWSLEPLPGAPKTV
jgi:hypothetical protein